MPIPILHPISPNAVVLQPAGGAAGIVMGTPIAAYATMIVVYPTQVCGFIPLSSCSATECRTFNGSCYNNPVFGTINVSGTNYVNDVNTFLIDDQMRRITVFTLQKKDDRHNIWNDIVTIGSTNPLLYPAVLTYGTFYNYGHFAAHPTYVGMQIDWGHVIALQGAGLYKIKVSSPNIFAVGRPNPFPYCSQSESFKLKSFNCNLANHTVKFEANISGRIGSITTDGQVFDLCNMVWSDSIRVKGFFGFETTSYDEILREAQTGIIDRVRDEAIQKFDFIGLPMPKYIHDRLKVYGLMADFLFVSDYNLNNSDYNIKLKSIIKAAGYEPKYYKGTRLQSVKTQFKEGIQSVIKSSSCQNLR